MQLNELVRSELLDASCEAVREARRRERALLRSPIKAPANFSRKAIRRFCKEAHDELARRG